MALSLHAFGDRVGCDYTTASRLLSGERAPSTRLLGRICSEFELDANEALEVLSVDRAGGSDRTAGFADWLRSKVFAPGGEQVLDTQTTNG